MQKTVVLLWSSSRVLCIHSGEMMWQCSKENFSCGTVKPLKQHKSVFEVK